MMASPSGAHPLPLLPFTLYSTRITLHAMLCYIVLYNVLSGCVIQRERETGLFYITVCLCTYYTCYDVLLCHVLHAHSATDGKQADYICMLKTRRWPWDTLFPQG